MKKMIALILSVMMVLSLCACAGSGNAEGEGGQNGLGEGLNVGFARENITPDFSVGLGGYSDAETRRSEGFIDYIYVTCIAVTEGEETILIYTLDNCAAPESIAEKMRTSVTEATGIAGEKIFVGATHSHSCPSLSTSDNEGAKYMDLLMAATATAAEKALADRAPATISAGVTEIELMNFVRHYEMSDGTYAGSNFGSFSNATTVAHAAETDPRMVLVKFDRADDKQDVLLVNWQAHPDHGTENGRNNISADFPGALREKVMKETNMLVAYFTGASGNQNPDSRITSETHNLSMKEYGEKLAEHAVKALENLQPVEGTGISTTRVMYDAPVDHSWDHLLGAANEVYDLWKSAGKTAGDALGKTYDFTSSYQARAIKTRAAMGLTRQIELNAFRIHGLGFTTGTYEMFSTAGLYVRENSPYDITFIMTGNSGYIPNEMSYDYRSYEADTGYFAKGTSEALAQKYVEMLESVQ